MDRAFAQSNPEGLVEAMGETVVSIGTGGERRLLTHGEVLDAARRSVRPLSGRAIRQSHTAITSLTHEGRMIVVRGIVTHETAGRDPVGTFADVTSQTGFEDNWEPSNGVWTIISTRQTSFRRTARAQPSPSAMLALQNMRASAAALRNFNSSNNYSQCMNADQTQHYEYETRRQYCSH